MLIKIDHTVSSHVAEDRGDVVKQLENSTRMYSWVKGEIVGDVIDKFAVANRQATFGDFIEWTKRTYMDRLEALQNGRPFTGYRLDGDYNPTKAGQEPQAKFGKHGESAKGTTVISDAAPSRLKPRKVAEPGQEAALDAADAAALTGAEEPTENPTAPPADLSKLKPIEDGQQPDKTESDAFAAFKAKNKL